ncbi:hypothetical protein D3C85_1459650 [compost metagenome]
MGLSVCIWMLSALLDRGIDGGEVRFAFYVGDNSLRSTSDTTPSAATTRWSSRRISTRASASFSAWVKTLSDRLGSGLPLGWLCTAMMAAQLSTRPRLTTSRG